MELGAGETRLDSGSRDVARDGWMLIELATPIGPSVYSGGMGSSSSSCFSEYRDGSREASLLRGAPE